MQAAFRIASGTASQDCKHTGVLATLLLYPATQTHGQLSSGAGLNPVPCQMSNKRTTQSDQWVTPEHAYDVAVIYAVEIRVRNMHACSLAHLLCT